MEQKAKHPLASPWKKSEASFGLPHETKSEAPFGLPHGTKSEAPFGLPHGTKSEAPFGLPLLKGDGRGIDKGDR